VKTKLLIIAVIFTALGIIVALVSVRFYRLKKPTAGLKIETTPTSMVFVNNVQVGRTPFDQMFPPGETTVKLIPESISSDLSSYQTKVLLTDKVYTVIRREFGSPDNRSTGETISLLPQSGKNASLSIISSDPDTASVTVNGEPQGFTPLAITEVAPSDHQIEVSAPGYQTRIFSAKAVSGYKLSVNVKLAAKNQANPTPPQVLSLPTPAATPSATPKVTPTITKPYVKISSTPVGFLRVRNGPSKTASEIAQIKPGEIYPLLDSASGWYQIKISLPATSSGWISSEYAQAFK
jgi:hypothetical protein